MIAYSMSTDCIFCHLFNHRVQFSNVCTHPSTDPVGWFRNWSCRFEQQGWNSATKPRMPLLNIGATSLGSDNMRATGARIIFLHFVLDPLATSTKYEQQGPEGCFWHFGVRSLGSVMTCEQWGLNNETGQHDREACETNDSNVPYYSRLL